MSYEEQDRGVKNDIENLDASEKNENIEYLDERLVSSWEWINKAFLKK